MSTITRERAAGIAKGEKCYTHDDVVELARIALASLELERGMIRRFDLDMSDCDSCGQDCGADMVEDLDGEYVLWDEVLPYLYRYDEYTAPPVPASVPDEIEPTVEAIKRVLPTSNPDEYAACIGADMWNACRAAMLQGADGNSPVVKDCSCHTCRPVIFTDMRFVACPECGNKRCPHANDHRHACTGSNEPGQEGSAYPAAPKQEAK